MPAKTIAERIRAAHLPADAPHFTFKELEAAGVWDHYRATPALRKVLPDLRKLYPELCLILLLALEQTRLLRAAPAGRPAIESELAKLRKDAVATLDPVRQHKLRRQAQELEGQHEVRQRQQPEQVWQAVCAELRKQRADPAVAREQMPTHLEDRDWLAPMTRDDFVLATGRTLRTVRRFLESIEAQPMRPRARRNEPDRYGTEVTLQVFTRWLLDWERDPTRRRHLLGRTLLFALRRATNVKDVERRVRQLHPAIKPVFDAMPPLERQEFVDYLPELKSLLGPADTPTDPLLRCLALPRQ